jgi:eukaryotic-like serine/threonine-protein kinase
VARVLVGRYELEVPLGRGMSGEVWRGRDIPTRRPVAVKLIQLTEIGDSALVAETIARFRREAATLARLKHPNIVAALEAGRIGDELFLVMELAEGVSLASMLEQREANNLGLFPVASVLLMAGQACAALAAAHAAGVVHRDIKPSNLMVATRLHITIIDFGIARLLTDNSPRLTMPAQAVGTLAYISPEQLSGIDVDGRADLYSFGCVLYELLAGHPPFLAEVPAALLRMQLQERAVPLDSIRPDLPAGLSQLVDDMMEKERSARPADAGQVLRRIQAISAGLSRDMPEHEADRQTIRKVTAMDNPATGGSAAAGGPGRRPFAPEADRQTVPPADILVRHEPNPAEAGRSTRLTPDRLADLSGPAEPGPATGYPGSRSAYQQPPAQHPDSRPAVQGTQPVDGPTWPDATRARSRRRRPRWRGIVSTLITFAIVGGIGAYVWVRTHQPALKVTGVSVALASPLGNACNVTADLVGTIVTNGKGGPVTYQWVQNTNPPMPAATVTNATGANTVTVTLKWTFHGKGTLHSVAELHVISPNAATSNTEFTYSCA